MEMHHCNNKTQERKHAQSPKLANQLLWRIWTQAYHGGRGLDSIWQTATRLLHQTTSFWAAVHNLKVNH